MDFIKEKIKTMTETLDKRIISNLQDISFDYIPVPEYKTDNTPPSADAGWMPFEKNARVGGKDNHFWVKFKLAPQPSKDGKELRLSVKTGLEGEWDATNPQGLVFLNGITTQALDTHHTWLPLKYDTEYEVYIYFYTGMENGLFDVKINLIEADIATEGLYYDIKIPYDTLNVLDESSYDYIKIRNIVDKALLKLDLREFFSPEYYKSIDEVRSTLKAELYDKECDGFKPTVNCIGHTHIDVAWLWTVAQTREKAQRSFSTVCNMMERFDDYKFMSSQPQLYQYIKEQDPELYARIKKYVAEGRWEVEGAMWLEADCNLISGESMVRQILHGKKFMKDEFGVDSKILWLPDVFGYSAALPQILQKSGISQFFTTKLTWNESNKMPHDTFIWEGIDGTEIFASLIEAYVTKLEPNQLHRTWDIYKDKSFTDTTLLTFGYGDGGGGPTYKMMENYERLKNGLPGMPKAVIGKAGEFFDKIEDDFNKNASELCFTPKWSGELYLEMHRGTFTSIASVKKNNRLSELGIMTAEALAAFDMAVNGGEYPDAMLNKHQKTVLLNQFHDIIPGSSIKEVYEVCDKEYAEILSDLNSIINTKLDTISSHIDTDGGILVYNPTPFDVSDTISVDGKRVYADNIPAHGWRVIKDTELQSEIQVSDNVIENSLVRVTFDKDYHIVSLFDKEADREVIPRNAKGNVLEVFEDYPRAYDAWEISSYYKQKMWLADDVSEVSHLENGIKIKRVYKNSTIEQEITLNENSKRVDFRTKVDWHEDHVLLKAAFPVDIHSSFATYDIQFGNVERPTHRNTSWDAAKFEVCGHKWADLSETGYGVSLINDCKYGYSIEENVMKLSLLKAATYPSPVADRGVHEFTYSIYPHIGDFREGRTIEESYNLNMPLLAKAVSPQSGNLADNGFIVNCDCNNVISETVKKAEDGNSIIVRLFEAHNKKSTASVTTGFDFSKAYLCDLMENNIEELAVTNNTVTVPVKNFEIITLKFEK